MAPPVSAAYHVKLNGKGYILVDQSYQKKSQIPFTPRFASGSYGYGDLSFWQFLTQEDFTGGAGQKDFTTTNKYLESFGWSLLSGKPRLCGGSLYGTDSGITPPSQILNVQNGVSTGGLVPCQLLIWESGSAGSGSAQCDASGLRLIGPTTYRAPGTITQLKAPGTPNAGVTFIDSHGAAVWQRVDSPANPGYIIFGKYSGGLWNISVHNIVSGAGLLSETCDPIAPQAIVPISKDAFLFFGRRDPGGANPVQAFVCSRWDLTADTFAGVTKTTSFAANLPFYTSPHWAKDSLGTIYLVHYSYDATTTSDIYMSAMSLLLSADQTLTSGPRLSEVVYYHDYVFQGAVAINGTVYMIGAKVIRNGASTTFRPQVVKFPNTVIWESSEESETALDIVPRGINQINRSEAYFTTGLKGSGRYQRVMRIMPGDVVEEIFSYGSQGTDNIPLATAVARIGASVYLYDVIGNKFIRCNSDPSRARMSPSTINTLTTSRMGANTSMIKKSLYKILIELSLPIPIGESMPVYANNILVGTIVNSSGLLNELIVSNEIVDVSFSISLRMTGGSRWGTCVGDRPCGQRFPCGRRSRAG